MANDRTETVPETERMYHPGSDRISAIGAVGTGDVRPVVSVPATMGREETCDVRFDHPTLSKQQAILKPYEGQGGGMHVTNIAAEKKNDMVWLGGIARSEFVMMAGDYFDIGKQRYFALTWEMQHVRPGLVESLGLGRDREIDEFLITAARSADAPIALTGPWGCDQDALARVIHRISHRRHAAATSFFDPQLDDKTINLLPQTRGGTAIVHHYARGRLDQEFVAAATDESAALRLIFCAASPDRIKASVPRQVYNALRIIELRPLCQRVDDMPALFDKAFASRRSIQRFLSLPLAVQEGLQTYSWPENLDELRKAATPLAQLPQYRSISDIKNDSEALYSSLRRLAKKIGIEVAAFYPRGK